MKKIDWCQCMGVRCGKHPLGLCKKKPVQKYAFRFADSQLLARDNSYRMYCTACAEGLKAVPWDRRKDPEAPQS